MTFAATRLRFLALSLAVVVPLIGAPPVRGQNIVAQWAFGGDTGDPVSLRKNNDPVAESFLQLARSLDARVTEVGPQSGPKIEITD